MGRPGISINDGTYPRFEAGEVEPDQYGATIRDANGLVTVSLCELQNVWVKVYDEYVTGSPVTQINISGLHGNTDQVYYIVWTVKCPAGAGDAPGLDCRINGDTGANYGFTYMGTNGAEGIFAKFENGTSWSWLDTDAWAQTGQCFAVLDAKSGKMRTSTVIAGCRIVGTNVQRCWQFNQVWNNIVDEITSLLFFSTKTGGIGIGSHLSIYKIPAYA